MKHVKSIDVSDEVAEREVIDQTILLNLEDGEYYSLDDTAAFVWSLIKTTDNLEKIKADYQQQFNTDLESAEKDLREIISEFEDAKLLRQ